MEGRLVGKVIVVAGGGGIGDELARRYAYEGASVVLGDIDGEAAALVASTINASGGAALATALDGADEASIRALVDLAMDRFGGLHGFHANYAGFESAMNADATDIEVDEYDRVMSVNARGFLLCTRHAVPAMVKSGGGSMIYTSSGAAYSGEPVRVAYAMSKSAIHALMRHTAVRFGPEGVRANVIAPGVIAHRRFAEVVPQEVQDAFRAQNLLKSRLGNPADIAAMGALLMSDEGSYITGQVLSVDGGNTMRA